MVCSHTLIEVCEEPAIDTEMIYFAHYVFAIKLYQTCTIEWVVVNFVSGRNRKRDQAKDEPILCQS